MWLAIPEPHHCRKPGHYTDSWRKRKRAASRGPNLISVFSIGSWLRGLDLNQRALGYESNKQRNINDLRGTAGSLKY